MPTNRLRAYAAASLSLNGLPGAGFVACPIACAANPMIEQLYRCAWEEAVASARFAWLTELSAVHNN